MPLPQVIFLDAVGTLFGVRGTVGEIYAQQALKFGVSVSPQELQQAFFESFVQAPSAAFPEANPEDIPQLEFNYWQAITTQSFQRIGAFDQFSDFSEFFNQLYHYFATSEPWFVYPDALETISIWRKQGIPLGVLSNFDSRLYSVLKALQLNDFFSSVTISTEIGAAKPSSQIFRSALQKHDCLAEAALHIGDSFKEDYQGAQLAGLQAIWLDRNGENQVLVSEVKAWKVFQVELEEFI